MSGLRRWLLVVVAIGPLAAAGCKTKMLVSQYPSFYDPKLQSVAVLPFGNATLHQMASPYVTRRFANALKGNGTYPTVLTSEELKSRLDQAGLKLEPEATIEQTAEVLRKLGNVQTFVTGVVSAFRTAQSVYVDVDYYDDWGYGWGWGYRPYGYWRGHRGYYGPRYYYPSYSTYTYTRAQVSARATMWRVADATQIFASPRPVSANVQTGDGIATYPDEALEQATDLTVQGLLAEFAIVPRTLEVKVNDTLKIARRLPNDELKETDNFRADDKELTAIVHLPKPAALNPFRLAVTRRDSDGVLAEGESDWPRGQREQQFHFPLAELIQSGGLGKYDIHLYVNDQFVLKRGFTIRQ